jgi:hypothetical protein
MYECMQVAGGNYQSAGSAFWLGFWSLQLVQPQRSGIAARLFHTEVFRRMARQ